MCGIIGYKSFSGQAFPEELQKATIQLAKRGPDNQHHITINHVGLGHARLSILDTSSVANQPMHDASGRYTIIFNGEVYNYKELEKELRGISLQSTSDTEVLLHLLIQKGKDCLEQLNGFFAFAFYDKEADYLLLARDRFGIKPLHIYQDEDKIIFASELKAILRFPIKKVIDRHSLFWYLKLNYLPGPMSMLHGVQKLLPGHYLEIHNKKVTKGAYFQLEGQSVPDVSYSDAQTQLIDLLDQSVQRRLIADVPLGSFLSGGTDSSAIVALASRHTNHLSTFSIGYKDHPFFDETSFAELVARKFHTNHTVFPLTNDDLLHEIDDILSYIDEPFADSSAIPTYILAKNVRQNVTVALSGDGADELFGGYYKHMALHQSLGNGLSQTLVRIMSPITKALPQSRSGKLSNLIRRIDRFGTMLQHSPMERYWYLASLTEDPSALLGFDWDEDKAMSFKRSYFKNEINMNDYLDADLQVVLAGDMLVKVDLMSMANGLEVRVPFLDKAVVAFARSLPVSFKLKGNERKRIVQDAFRTILPEEIYHRPKKGFEVPLLHWMRNELLSDLDQYVFNPHRLDSQGLFNTDEVLLLKKKLRSHNPGDVHGTIWALFVFQKWYENYFT